MEARKLHEPISLDRRRLLGTTAAGIVTVGFAGVMSSPLMAASDAVRPLSRSTFPKRTSLIFAGAFTLRAGLTGRRSMTARRAYRSRSSSSW